MPRKQILREQGKVKAQLTIDDYGTHLQTMRNGYQWTGQPMTKELAKLTIEVLQEYLNTKS